MHTSKQINITLRLNHKSEYIFGFNQYIYQKQTGVDVVIVVNGKILKFVKWCSVGFRSVLSTII